MKKEEGSQKVICQESRRKENEKERNEDIKGGGEELKKIYGKSGIVWKRMEQKN